MWCRPPGLTESRGAGTPERWPGAPGSLSGTSLHGARAPRGRSEAPEEPGRQVRPLPARALSTPTSPPAGLGLSFSVCEGRQGVLWCLQKHSCHRILWTFATAGQHVSPATRLGRSSAGQVCGWREGRVSLVSAQSSRGAAQLPVRPQVGALRRERLEGLPPGHLPLPSPRGGPQEGTALSNRGGPPILEPGLFAHLPAGVAGPGEAEPERSSLLPGRLSIRPRCQRWFAGGPRLALRLFQGLPGA